MEKHFPSGAPSLRNFSHFAALGHHTLGPNLVLTLDLLVAQSLTIPLSVVVFHILLDGMSPEQFEQNE